MVGLEQEGVAGGFEGVGGWGDCLKYPKYLKREWSKKEERGNKDCRKEGVVI